MPHVRAHIQANVSCSAGWDLGENSPRHSLDTTPVTSGIRTQGQLTHIHLRAVRKIGLAWRKLCSDSKGCGHVSSNPTPVWHLRARRRIEGRVTVAIEGRVTTATRVQLLDLANSDDIATEGRVCCCRNGTHTSLKVVPEYLCMQQVPTCVSGGIIRRVVCTLTLCAQHTWGFVVRHRSTATVR